jgi:phenylacetate-CoA ligase
MSYDEVESDEDRDNERRRLQEAIQSALQRLERASPIEVAETQLAALERIVRHARDTTSFYADRLAPLFVEGEFTPQHWASVPILTREEAQENSAAIRSDRLPEGTEAHEGETSGSSGTPLKFAWSTLSSISTRAVVERMAVWHGLDSAAPLAEIRSFPAGYADFPGRRLQRSWSFRNPAAPYYRLRVTTPVAQQLAWLKLVEPRLLLTYPTMARELAETCLAEGIALRFDAVLTVGEVLTPEIRELCRAAFGAKTIDSYGCQEMGKIAVECEVSGHYHVCASNVLLEILDEHGRQVPSGGSGRIVLTSLYNYATPFIRYELGDFGRLGGACPCGRSLPVLTEILGRRRNMITLPDGNRLWLPGRALAAMAAHVPMKRMRLVQTAPDAFDLLYLPKDDGGEPDLPRLQACAAHHIHPHARIHAIPVRELPRSPGGKYEDVVGLG